MILKQQPLGTQYRVGFRPLPVVGLFMVHFIVSAKLEEHGATFYCTLARQSAIVEASFAQILTNILALIKR